MASKKAIGVISKLLEHTTTKPIPEDSLETWVLILEPLSDDLALKAAMRVARATRRCFAVAPGAIYQTALEILREGLPTPGEAWRMLGVALDRVADRKGWLTFDKLPESIQEAAKQVGVRGMVNGDHLMADRARFIEFYRVITDRKAEARLALPSSAQDAITEGEE
jgi:hypothetical protein